MHPSNTPNAMPNTDYTSAPFLDHLYLYPTISCEYRVVLKFESNFNLFLMKVKITFIQNTCKLHDEKVLSIDQIREITRLSLSGETMYKVKQARKLIVGQKKLLERFFFDTLNTHDFRFRSLTNFSLYSSFKYDL